MSGPRITFACSLYDRMTPLFTGDVKAQGIDLDFVRNDSPREIFDRMAGDKAYDAAEFSTSEFISRRAAGDRSFVAIPAFPSRSFRHGLVIVNRKSGVRTPKDLEGRRVGVPLYTMTAALWIKGHLQHDYGVDISTIRWVQGAINGAGSHGKPTLMPLLKPVDIVNKPDGRSLSDLLEAGEIDAIIGTTLPNSMKTNPDIVRLWPDFRAVEKDYFRRTGIFPIMHLVAIRRDTWERHPIVAQSLFDALTASKRQALAQMRWLGALRYMLPWLAADVEEIDEVFGGDPWPYGLEANRKTLEALMAYMVDQHLIAEPIPIDDLFVPVA